MTTNISVIVPIIDLSAWIHGSRRHSPLDFNEILSDAPRYTGQVEPGMLVGVFHSVGTYKRDEELDALSLNLYAVMVLAKHNSTGA